VDEASWTGCKGAAALGTVLARAIDGGETRIAFACGHVRKVSVPDGSSLTPRGVFFEQRRAGEDRRKEMAPLSPLRLGIRALVWLPVLVVAGDAGSGGEAAPVTPPAPVAEAGAEAEEDDSWKAEIDRFLADYLPSAVGAAEPSKPGDPFEIELPELRVEAIFDEARRQRLLPDAWEILSDETKRQLLADRHLTALETKVLNRWILPWGIRPDAYLAEREERWRLERSVARNAEILRILEEVRPGTLAAPALRR
jgi:hypothetical protein